MEENRCRARSVIGEVEKSVVGKTDILRKVMTAILAGGHVLIEDIPGTGKTTLALSFSHAMGLKVNRVQIYAGRTSGRSEWILRYMIKHQGHLCISRVQLYAIFFWQMR